MGKMKETHTKSKHAPKPSTAMTTKADANDRERTMAAIKAMQARGFQEIAEDNSCGTLEETGLVDKADLEGVPFVIVSVERRDGDFGTYVSVTAILESNEVVVFNDGSTGIMAQLEGY